MATEVLYATSHIAGSFTNPENAVGSAAGTWATTSPTVTTTSRWAIANPSDPLTSGYTTHQILVRARSSGSSPGVTLQINLWQNGTLVSTGVAQAVTSTIGQDITRTFTTAQISDPAGIEVELVATPSGTRTVQVDYIQVTVDTTFVIPVKVWNGTAWVDSPIKMFDGSSWVTPQAVKTFSGSTWV